MPQTVCLLFLSEMDDNPEEKRAGKTYQGLNANTEDLQLRWVSGGKKHLFRRQTSQPEFLCEKKGLDHIDWVC